MGNKNSPVTQTWAEIFVRLESRARVLTRLANLFNGVAGFQKVTKGPNRRLKPRGQSDGHSVPRRGEKRVHEMACVRVTVDVKVLVPIVCLTAFAADLDLPKTLKGIEGRYNSIKTLELDFQQTYVAPNRARRVESGKLFLRKPGRMRWQYAKPEGKLFVSDGTNYWYYSPQSNRAEKMKLKEATDMQAPLAFLLGRLDFNRDFGRFTVSREGDFARIKAEPKNLEKSPYREVTFVVSADAQVHSLEVKGQDASTMAFQFRNEVRNPAQREPDLYRFTPPPGVEVVQ